MSTNYLSLGDIKFQGLKGFESFDPSLSVNYAEHALILGKPRLQRMGTNLQKISGSIVFHRSFCTPETEIRALEDAMLNSTVLPLVYGNGTYVGDFVILSLNKSVKQTFPNGSFLEVVIDIEFSEYYDPDKLKTIKDQAKRDGFASNSASAIPIVKMPDNPVSDEREISEMVNGLSVNARSVSDAVSSAQLSPDQTSYYAGVAMGSLEKVDSYINSILGVIESNPNIQSVSGLFTENLELLSRSTQDYIGIMPNITSNEALEISSYFQEIVKKVRSSSLSVVTGVITRRLNG